MKEIAKHYGCGETLIWTRIREYGITFDGAKGPRGKKRKYPARTREHKRNLSRAFTGRWAGEKNPHWKGGVHQVNLSLRGSGEYKQWKLAALELANYQCQSCGVAHNKVCKCCGMKARLHVHHVKSFSAFPDSRFDPKNSEVLCLKCHNHRHDGKLGELLENP